MRRNTLIILAIIVIIFIGGWFFFVPRDQRTSFVALGTVPFNVVVHSRSLIEFGKDMVAVKSLVGELEAIYSKHLAGSQLSKLNASGVAINLHPRLLDTIAASKKWQKISGGAFDPTVGPLLNLWKKAAAEKKLPPNSEIQKALKLIGMDKVVIEEGGVKFLAKGMSLDLGAIAKGTIVDACVELLQGLGVKSGIVDAGGDISLFGQKEHVVGIQSPMADDLVAKLKCGPGAVVTSGNYARNFEIDGKKYSHIVDPRNGWPLQEQATSTTVVAPDAESADALATAMMVMGVKASKHVLETLGSGYGAVFVVNGSDGKLEIIPVLEKTQCQIINN